tara:strand:+ start:12 stop:578 length:567 start_codon:yes stop_codon:yes gene_type:complete
MKYKLMKVKNNLKNNYKIICTQIKSSIFFYLGFNFFRKMVLENIIHVYNVKNKSKISAIFTVIEFKNYKLINSKIFFYLLTNPLILIKNIAFFIESLKKNTNLKIKANYLHLLHLVIFKKEFFKISIKKKDLIINNFYKVILKKHKANCLFLCFEKKNYKAFRYYKRNNFKILDKNQNIIYMKKNFKI